MLPHLTCAGQARLWVSCALGKKPWPPRGVARRRCLLAGAAAASAPAAPMPGSLENRPAVNRRVLTMGEGGCGARMRAGRPGCAARRTGSAGPCARGGGRRTGRRLEARHGPALGAIWGAAASGGAGQGVLPPRRLGGTGHDARARREGTTAAGTAPACAIRACARPRLRCPVAGGRRAHPPGPCEHQAGGVPGGPHRRLPCGAKSISRPPRRALGRGPHRRKPRLFCPARRAGREAPAKAGVRGRSIPAAPRRRGPRHQNAGCSARQAPRRRGDRSGAPGWSG